MRICRASTDKNVHIMHSALCFSVAQFPIPQIVDIWFRRGLRHTTSRRAIGRASRMRKALKDAINSSPTELGGE